MQDLHEAEIADAVTPSAPTDGEDAVAIAHLIGALERGVDWPTAVLEAMSIWRTATETIGDRRNNYFVGGEAFDWMLMAERLCEVAGTLIPDDEREELLFSGRFPESFDAERFKELLGAQKHSGFLNYYYGVVVEEALQLAVEREVHKRAVSNGNQYQGDFSEEAYFRIYRRSLTELLQDFCAEMGYINEGVISLSQCKEFLYWLFKYRMRISDKAKVASDTRKGIAQLREIAEAQPQTGGGYAPEQP
ncbi:MAG: hypothetical protein F4X57_01030 [Chloroflexi bacterium]|nr:hypothetical protein [Chloroflexota bacterium]